MKYTMIRLAIAILLGAVVGNSANAGFGSHGGMFGGGSGGASTGYGSSGGAGYGSSGGAGYGSSGGASYSGYGSSGGSYVASYGSSGGGSSGGVSAGGSSGRPGLLSRLHTRVHSHIAAKHARRANYASSGGGSSGGYAGYGSSGGSVSGGSSGSYYSGYSSVGGGSSGSVSYGSTGSVSYGSTGASYGSTGASYGSTGSSYGSTGSAIHSGYGSAGSSVPYYSTSTSAPSATSALVSSTRSDDSVKLNVTVPESAKVYVNDRLTTSTGEVRQFVSRGLESGKSYRFEIRAEMNDNGKVVTDTQSVVVTAGSQEHVRFAMTAPKAAAKVDTAVVLNVPENAEVTLAGNQTQVKGTTRVFKTSQLKEGDVWDDYVIQVKVGEQVKTQSIRLIAGDKLELSFDFDNDANRLAAK